MKKLISKKAQGWGLDVIMAVSIFTIGLVAFYIYSLNSPGEAKEKLETLSYDGKILANTVLSEGSPINWDETNVVKIGILTDNKINETKLQNFYELAKDNYQETKSKFDISYDYYFYLNDEMDINGDGSLIIDGIGKPEINRDDTFTNAKNLVKITRYTVYKNKPMAAYFYIWEE